MEKIGRNDPCHCGSGQKYKKCCLAKDGEADALRREEERAVQRALSWLEENYSDEVDAAVHVDFMGDPDQESMDAFDSLPSHLLAATSINVGEWLLCDAELMVDGKAVLARELILGTGGPLLTAHGRQYLEELGRHSLSLYEVKEAQKGEDEGPLLADLLNPDQPPVRVAGKEATKFLFPKDIVGTRLIRQDDGWVMSSALYLMERNAALDCAAKIGRAIAEENADPALARYITTCSIVDDWLDSLFEPLLEQMRDAEPGEGPQAGMGVTMDDLKKLLKEKEFGSLEEAKAFIGQQMGGVNQVSIDDFHGLSPEQMHRLLYFPFDTPELVTVPDRLDDEPQAPILTLFKLLCDAVGSDGLKATATGNLPRQFCRDAALALWGEEKYREETRYGEIRTEPDFFDLHVTRLLAVMARLMRLYKGKFVLIKECQKVLAKEGMAGIYPRLFRTFAREYNWSYRGGWQDVPMVQFSFLFTLHLLTRYGAEWRTSRYYEDCFLRAFPMLLHQVKSEGDYFTPEKVLRRAYSHRCLQGLELMGLIQIELDPADPYTGDFRLKSLPLLSQAVRFHLPQ
jgi:hypothetical protein